jgi:hypothetical protein
MIRQDNKIIKQNKCDLLDLHEKQWVFILWIFNNWSSEFVFMQYILNLLKIIIQNIILSNNFKKKQKKLKKSLKNHHLSIFSGLISLLSNGISICILGNSQNLLLIFLVN